MLVVLRKIELFQVKKKDKVKVKTSRIQPRKLKRWHVQEKDVVMKVKWHDILVETKTMHAMLVETKTMLVLRKIELL